MDDYLSHFIAGPDGIDHLQPIYHLAEAGMVAVEVSGIGPGVADKELGTTGIAACMCHGKHTAVVVLVATGKLTIDFVARSPGSGSGRVAALDYEIGNYPVENKAVVVAFFRQGHEIFYSVRGIVVVELDFHHPFFGVDFSGSHEGNVK